MNDDGVVPFRSGTGSSARRRGLASGALCLAVLFLGACTTLPPSPSGEASEVMRCDRGDLGRAAVALGTSHPGQSGVRLLADGLDAFAGRAVLADAAECGIDVQYYLFHNDMSGILLTARLLAAADRGVRVRLLIDDMDTAGRDPMLAALDSHPLLEVRLFNPFSNRGRRYLEMLTRFGQVSRRMHNKSFTVDGAATIVGGRNVGNEYFSAHPDVEFGDLDVLALGSVADDVGRQFDLYWNSELAYPVSALHRRPLAPDALEQARSKLVDYEESMRDSEYAVRVRDSRLVQDLLGGGLHLKWAHGQLFYDEPEKLLLPPEDRSTHMGPRLLPTLDEVKSEALIFSPYFVPGDEGVEILGALARRGVKVEVVTNSLASNDVGLVHSGYAKYRQALLEQGVSLYEFKPAGNVPEDFGHGGIGNSARASLHAKTFVYDRERLFVGSLNLDPRSAVLNTEMGTLFASPELAGGIADWFDDNRDEVAYRLSLVSRDAEDSGAEARIRWYDKSATGERIWSFDPETGFVKRLLVRLMGLLPIEGQL